MEKQKRIKVQLSGDQWGKMYNHLDAHYELSGKADRTYPQIAKMLSEECGFEITTSTIQTAMTKRGYRPIVNRRPPKVEQTDPAGCEPRFLAIEKSLADFLDLLT